MRSKAKSRRITALVLAVLLIVLAGCSKSGDGGQSNEGNTAAANNQATADNQPIGENGSNDSSEGPKSFELWLGWTATINNESLVQKYWREKEPGIDVKLEATQGDATTALNLKMNTGGFKDAALFGNSDAVKNAMKRPNQIMPLEQYFDMPDKYPSLAAIPKQYLDRMKDEDGHIWAIPTWFDQNPDDPWPGWASAGWFVRTDVVEKTGMKLEDLATIEGVETFLKKASEQKDASGKPFLPLSFLMDPNDSGGYNDEVPVLNAFGVSTSGVEKVGEQFVFAYDNPNYKSAYQWLNKLYREKLIDPEVVTSKKEQYQEKNKAGRVAMNVGAMWNIPNSAWETLEGPTDSAWYYEVIPFPKVNGVEKIGINQVINPNPQYNVYISKDTKSLEAILKFFDYTLQAKPEMQQIVNEGPVGLYWDWTDSPLGKWKYIDESYSTPRNSGDAAQKAKVTPELYMASSFNNSWYPWWNVADNKAGYNKTTEFTEKIGKMGAVRSAHSYDLVIAKPGGVWEKYNPEVENVRKEYRAKLILAKNDEQFESVWNQFRDALEKRAHWTEMKAEWLETYIADIQAHGEF